ncbi:hypothetical protein WJX74_003902 [Apatococcus lobatus]|uniref:Uncharacterized protein n=1 Tax=Apatococcus lobatus TaxID=904363 RepID=A0AAW1QZI4_9CHLO
MIIAAAAGALGWALSPPAPPQQKANETSLTHVTPQALTSALQQPVASNAGRAQQLAPVLPYYSHRASATPHVNRDGTLAGAPIQPARAVALNPPPKPQSFLGKADTDLDEQMRARAMESAAQQRTRMNHGNKGYATGMVMVRKPDPQQSHIDTRSLPVTSLTRPAHQIRMDRAPNPDGPAFGVGHNQSVRDASVVTKLPEQATTFKGRAGPASSHDRNPDTLERGVPSPFQYMPIPKENCYLERLGDRPVGHGIVQSQPFEQAEVRTRPYATYETGARQPNPDAVGDLGDTPLAVPIDRAPKMRTVTGRVPNGTFVDQKKQGFDLGFPLHTHQPFDTIEMRDPNGAMLQVPQHLAGAAANLDTHEPYGLELQYEITPELTLDQEFSNPFFVPYACVDRFDN